MNIGNRTIEEYLALAEDFHGYPAPGIILGGFMVELAKRQLPPDILYDAVSETKSCLPDAIQILTPCTIGNGWLRVINLGRYALSLFDKHTGHGFRVWLDADKLERWPEFKKWFFILAPKKEQDSKLLLEEICAAGDSVCSVRAIQVPLDLFKKRHKDKITLCPLCGEAYPGRDGGICRGCQGEAPYENEWRVGREARPASPPISAVPVEAAVGKEILHDMTQIVPGQTKGPVFKRGQKITVGDLCRLQQMGKRHVYLQDDATKDPNWVHEDTAALAFAEAMAGDGVTPVGPPREGKVNLQALRNGLFIADTGRLNAFNLVPDAMCACRQSFSVVETGMNLAGTRAIPLLMPKIHFERAMTLLDDGPLFKVLPMRQAKVGILVTGSEVFQGLVEDRFIPIITSKVEKYQCDVVKSLIAPDDRRMISDGVRELLQAGADLIVTTGGLSVDPDDVTRLALMDCGLQDMLYGAPILPGAMTFLARLNGTQVMGVPACALYFKTTSFDVLLPRLLAGLRISRQDLADLGHGAMCLECKTCTYPKCTFGR